MKSLNTNRNKALTAEWSTPLPLFKLLDNEFHFTLDACAQPFNAKCKKFFSPKVDGLTKSWNGETVFCCPPSGARNFRLWTKKAFDEAKQRNTTVVMLLPVSTDSKWFWDNIYLQNGVTIRFLKERVKFENPAVPSWVNGNKSGTQSGMRPTMVVIFRGDNKPFHCE